MRVRIVKDSRFHATWLVETKIWFSAWKRIESFYGDDAEQGAEQFAKGLLNPVVREITKDSK